MRTNYKTAPSWGVIAIFRQHGIGGKRLFESLVDNYTTMVIEISRASVAKEGSYSHVMNEEQLISIEMSPLQWAEFLSSMNMGVGTPCTIRNIGREPVEHEEQPHVTEQYESEFKDRARNIAQGIRDLVAHCQEKKLPKATVMMMESIARQLDDGLPFLNKQFSESMSRVVSEAKTSVDAFITQAVHSTGLQALEGHNLALPRPPSETAE